MTSLTQHQALLVLNGLPHVGPVTLRRLLDAFDGDAIAVIEGEASKVRSVKGVGSKVVETLSNWQSRFDVGREEASMERKGVRFLTAQDVEYPALLRETYDPPIGLYWQGEYVVDCPCVAIVGTRRATLYGRGVAKRFAAELSQIGFCIVSGMARGTDTAAHEGALSVGGKTVAVFGCGLDIIYPPENIDLYKSIALHGAVASEFPFGRRADRQSFPMRNRVVAGMCEAVIVIESDKSGGSMITARFAGEQGRQLMAVPGRIDQVSSAGCHQLIRDGATMVTSVDQVLEELRYARPKPKPQVQQLDLGAAEGDVISAVPELSEMEMLIMSSFTGGEAFSLDALAERLKRPISEISATVMGLELKQQIVKRADGCFEAR